MKYGALRDYRDGDKCPKCKKGYIERVVVPGQSGSFLHGATSLIFTMGLAGDGSTSSYSYYRCNICGKEPTQKIYDKDEIVFEDKDFPKMKEKDFLRIIFIGVFFITLILSLSLAGGFLLSILMNL